MNKKIFKLLLIGLLFIGISVKADYSSTGIVPNYTTVYQGDTITFSLGNDYLWDETIIMNNYDDDNPLIGEPVKNEEGLYLAEPFYVVVDEDVFELDIDENKVPNENYNLIDFKKVSIDGSKKVYEFDFEVKNIEESVDASDGYDGVIDNIMVSNLKLKVAEDAKPGVYYIETFRAYDFDDTYENDTYVKEYMPITIIDKDSNSNKITKFTINTVSNGLIEKKEYSVDLEDNKYDYELLYFGDIDYTNISCNTRCLVKGIGSDVYYDDESVDMKYTVKYSNSKEEKYKLSNLTNNLSIEYDWLTDFNKSIIYISNDVSFANDTIAEMLKYIPNFTDGFKKFIYEYDKLNEYDKEVLSYLNDSIDDTYIYVIDGNQLVYSHKGELDEDEYKGIQKEITQNKIDNGVGIDSTISSCDNGNCSNNKDENIDIMSFISNNYMYVVIGLSILIVLLILIITIIKKKRK